MTQPDDIRACIDLAAREGLSTLFSNRHETVAVIVPFSHITKIEDFIDLDLENRLSDEDAANNFSAVVEACRSDQITIITRGVLDIAAVIPFEFLELIVKKTIPELPRGARPDAPSRKLPLLQKLPSANRK